MFYFVAGLGLAMLGALLWVAGGIQMSLVQPGPCDHHVYCNGTINALRLVGFLVMIGAPFLFWLVLPFAVWVQRHGPQSWRELPPSTMDDGGLPQATGANPPLFRAREHRP